MTNLWLKIPVQNVCFNTADDSDRFEKMFSTEEKAAKYIEAQSETFKPFYKIKEVEVE